MATDENIFLTQIDLLKEAVEIIANRADKIAEIERIRKSISDSESEKRAILGVFKVKSLRLFKDTLFFISVETKRTDPKLHYFLMPHVRTLVDVYVRFLHLIANCKDDNEQSLTCIAYQLLSYKFLRQDYEYTRTLSLYKNFLSSIKFNFPEKSEEYDFNWIKNKKIGFQSVKKVLTVANIEKYSRSVNGVFKPRETYNIYASFSEFLHGNPYYYNKESHNERFWVVGTCMFMSAFLIELIDLYSLEKVNARDFRIWLTKVNNSRTDFVTLWRSNAIKPNS